MKAHRDADPDPDAAERNLWAILAGHVATWPREIDAARMLGMSPVYVRRCYTEAWRHRDRPLPAAPSRVALPAQHAKGEEALLAYLRATPGDEWSKTEHLAKRFDLSETLISNRKRQIRRRSANSTNQ